MGWVRFRLLMLVGGLFAFTAPASAAVLAGAGIPTADLTELSLDDGMFGLFEADATKLTRLTAYVNFESTSRRTDFKMNYVLYKDKGGTLDVKGEVVQSQRFGVLFLDPVNRDGVKVDLGVDWDVEYGQRYWLGLYADWQSGVMSPRITVGRDPVAQRGDPFLAFAQGPAARGAFNSPARMLAPGVVAPFFVEGSGDAPPAVPEPSAWLAMILGFGLTGTAIRRTLALRAAGGMGAEPLRRS